MIYLVSNQKSLWKSDRYEVLDKNIARDMIMACSMPEYDSETEGLDPYTKKLLCTQYGLGKDQIVFDNTTIDIEYLRCVFEDPNRTFIGWNLSFDYKFLYYHNIVPFKQYDGIIAERVLYLGYPPVFHGLSLKDAAKFYLDIDLDKSVRGKIINVGLTEEVVNYAAHDVVYLTAIREKQLIDAKKKDLVKAIDFENEFVPVIAYMEYCGAKLDPVKWKAKMAKDQTKLDECSGVLGNWVTDYYNQNKGTKDNTVKKVYHIAKKDIGNECKIIPKNVIQVLDRKITDDGIDYTCEFPFPWIFRNMQGDLFNGFNTNPQCSINWSSSKQVAPFLEFLGLNCTVVDKKTKEKKKSVDIKTIAPQSKKSAIVDPYIAYKQAKILVDTFGQKFLDKLNPITHRIHPDYNSLGADTGRLSATNPSLMNLPRDEETRACFIAEKGNKWLSIDYSG